LTEETKARILASISTGTPALLREAVQAAYREEVANGEIDVWFLAWQSPRGKLFAFVKAFGPIDALKEANLRQIFTGTDHGAREMLAINWADRSPVPAELMFRRVNQDEMRIHFPTFPLEAN
jgi:hypothetical protein